MLSSNVQGFSAKANVDAQKQNNAAHAMRHIFFIVTPRPHHFTFGDPASLEATPHFVCAQVSSLARLNKPRCADVAEMS
jgi:hypothetical protein